jgi:hypothetical protein
MCYGDPGLATLMRDTEARMAPMVDALGKSQEKAPARPGLFAQVFGALVVRWQKEVRT